MVQRGLKMKKIIFKKKEQKKYWYQNKFKTIPSPETHTRIKH